MNVLFLTMSKMLTIESRGIYTDLMRKFREEGHNVYIVSPVERRDGLKTRIVVRDGVHIISVKTLNLQKTNIIEKGIGQLSIEFLYKSAIKKYCDGVKFDLVLYSTPPVTFSKVIRYLRTKNPQVLTYLLLKDIFPQNAVDLGMLKKNGFKSILYKFFRKKERTLYQLSDYIGCMSPANVKYVIDNNPDVDSKKVEIAPNSIELDGNVREMNREERDAILVKFGLPTDKPVFVYGGNLGKPQGIPFLLDCLRVNKDRNDCHFLVVGNGTEFWKVRAWIEKEKPRSVTLFSGLPKADYDRLVQTCAIGLIFLDYRFTIPNFPSRLLSYLEYRMPVICATDEVCDMGKLAVDNGFGINLPSNDVDAFTRAVDIILESDIKTMGERGFNFLRANYMVENTYNVIIKHFQV